MSEIDDGDLAPEYHQNKKKIPAKVFTGLSYVIVTAVEGGSYTRDDYREWKEYAHADQADGSFRAGVTVIPNRHGPYADLDKGKLPEIRVTPEWFHAQLTKLVTKSMTMIDDDDNQAPLKGRLLKNAILLLMGDEEVPGDCDVVDSGALLQAAVYGEVIYG
jgi:hypothetical protein